MLTIADDDAGVDERKEALTNVIARHRGSQRKPVVAAAWSVGPEAVMAPRAAFFAEHVPDAAGEAVGRVSAELVAPVTASTARSSTSPEPLTPHPLRSSHRRQRRLGRGRSITLAG
jgi:hypothetical protein